MAEKIYILDVIFNEFYGLKYEYRIIETDVFEINYSNINGELILDASFFHEAENSWLKEKSLPVLPLKNFDLSVNELNVDLITSKIPIIYGKNRFKKNKNSIEMSIDVFGSIFFMLSRYEELITKDRDQHNRFYSRLSIAFKEGFLERPIVDEYIEILWACLKDLWPGLQRRERKAKNVISCDVDAPYNSYVNSLYLTTRKIAGDLVKRKSLIKASQTLLNYIATRLHIYSFDPYNTFDWIMDVNEKVGNKVAFYFIVDHSVPEMDGKYNIYEPRIRQLIRKIHQRGHEIGLHGSYGSYKNQDQLHKEVKILKKVMEEEGISQKKIGIRQHYLRWNVSETPVIHETADLVYDSSLSYADNIGFRCGTCHEYSMYNLVKRKKLNICQRPLIVMECSVINEQYMGLGIGHNALQKMLAIKKVTAHFKGNYTLLWHNCSLQQESLRMLYLNIIDKE